MSISQGLLPEFDQEMAGTRKCLERVPEGKTEWQPHPKSMTLGRLAGHLAELPTWVVETMKRDELSLDGQYTPFISSSPKELLAMFDAKVAEARALIQSATDEDMMKPWSLKVRGQTAFTIGRPPADAAASTSGEEPCAESISGAPAGTSLTSSTKITPWRMNSSTTRRLWTIS